MPDTVGQRSKRSREFNRMTIQLRKAERRKAKLRIGMSGPSGSGKTFSALLLAKGITGGSLDKVAIIDTENGSADMYSHLGEFNVIRLEAPYTPERYIEAIDACVQAGMEVVIIDSVSHEWDGKGGLLESNELLGQSKFKGNNWAAWSVTTPRHQRFIESITTAKVHIITTARSKTDTIQTEDKKIKKVGLKEIQREGFEYELTLNFNIDRDGHYATVSKDRTNLFDKIDPFKITEETGKTLLDWAETGKEDTEAADLEKQKNLLAKKSKINQQMKKLGVILTKENANLMVKKMVDLDLVDENLDEISSRLEIMIGEKADNDKNTNPEK